jgi:hypothetical protein
MRFRRASTKGEREQPSPPAGPGASVRDDALTVNESKTASSEPAAGERQPALSTARRSRRGAMAWRTRDAGASAVGTLGSGIVLLARLVMLVAVLIALLIGLAIVLRDVDANPRNTIFKGIHEGANFFAGAFTGLITFNGHPKRAITVDWGIALLVYLFVGAVISGYIRRVGRGGMRFERSHRTPLR